MDRMEHGIGQSQQREELSPEELLRVIFDYTAKIANERNVDRVLMHMADMGREMIAADRCTVWLVDRQRDELWTKVAHGISELRIPIGAGLVGHAVATGKQIFIDDAYNNEEFREALADGALKTDQETGYHTKAIMVIPFRNNEGEITGCYQAVNKMTPAGVFSAKDMEILTLAASYSGKSLESAMLTQEIEETQKEIIITMGEIGKPGPEKPATTSSALPNIRTCWRADWAWMKKKRNCSSSPRRCTISAKSLFPTRCSTSRAN